MAHYDPTGRYWEGRSIILSTTATPKAWPFGDVGNLDSVVMAYKGRQKPSANERDFPHIIEVLVPPGGFGTRLDAMHTFHAEHGIQARHGRSTRIDERDYIRWCFTDLATATEIKSQFGGFELMPNDPIVLLEWGNRNAQGK